MGNRSEKEKERREKLDHALRNTDENNCPILERTADGISVGRCWFWLGNNKTCPRHGNVSVSVERYATTGKLQPEVWEEGRHGH